MKSLELTVEDITSLNDGDLRELIGRLCEAEFLQQQLPLADVTWGGAQEAADGGLDVSVDSNSRLSQPNFIPRNCTGFQVKKHSMGKAACHKEMLDGSNPKPILSEIADKKGAYIIVSGKDDCSDKMLKDRLASMQKAVGSLTNKDDLKLDFYGRSRILSWLHIYPSVTLWVRQIIGKPLSGWTSFGRWAATPIAVEDDFITDDHRCISDSSSGNQNSLTVLEGINVVREKLHSSGSAIRITGLSGVGKTRFAQALFESEVGNEPLPYTNTIYADLGNDLAPSASEMIDYLIANDSDTYIILDNCPPEVHRTLQKKVMASNTQIKLLSIEYDISTDKPEETHVIHIEPASEGTVSLLLQRRFPKLNKTNSNKIAEFSGGNARVALALADQVDINENLSQLSDEELFKRLFHQRKQVDVSLLESAETLSLIYSFDISNENNELLALGRISGIESKTLYRHQAELLRRHIAQKRGNWRAVLPHAISNKLARRAFENLPISQINTELFKEENERLLMSCAHRVSYLHDSLEAQALAESWIQEDAPLYNPSIFSPIHLKCFSYIAPVIPQAALSLLEQACQNAEFASRNNPNFNQFVGLLRQLAYDDEYFNRAANLLLKFAETEKHGERNNSIVNWMENLFSLYLSGTEATPSKRQAFIRDLFQSSNPRYYEIAKVLLNKALQTSSWSSFASFEFGARKRGMGWQPSTQEEWKDWYSGLIDILQELLQSDNCIHIDIAKKLIVSNFNGLWINSRCCSKLEDIVKNYGKDGVWPKLWKEIKSTKDNFTSDSDSKSLRCLEVLEKISAPKDIDTEIHAYIFSNTWDHIVYNSNENTSDYGKEIIAKVKSLGKEAAQDISLIEGLGIDLWQERFDSFIPFGEGLALGSSNLVETFKYLINIIQNVPVEGLNSSVLHGFIKQVYEHDPSLARIMQESTLEISNLKEHFVFLLCSTPLEEWSIQKLIDLATKQEINAFQFKMIAYGRTHEAISDNELSELLDRIISMEQGIYAAIEILSMRFFRDKKSTYQSTAAIFSVGRKVIRKAVAIGGLRNLHTYSLENTASYCLDSSVPQNEISDILDLIKEGIEEYRISRTDIEPLMIVLLKNFPELVLETILSDSDQFLEHNSIYQQFFKYCNEVSLNIVPAQRLLDWCNNDQAKVQQVANLLDIYTPIEEPLFPTVDKRPVELSGHIKAFFYTAKDKDKIVEIIYDKIMPNGWSNSLADVLESRARAFSELSNHASVEIQKLIEEKLALVNQWIQKEREREAQEHNQREQRFE
ncbi:hypothetical protein IOD06_08355 [Psychrobacter sp. N25K4-3-2]|uniref:hypothetical protein n=1 Tax=Psychrobacter sp. N25K4-3-2 TaxID=2785026 RepID=UPI00188D0675|nr:hypothetical protein [Psychrobacter sp. N25K4-3-2]MBF4489898.1 hypothetical protein [Psychrobacter sp. N25K4-3-2]